MQYDGLAWAFALLALLAALVAVRILFERTWFLGWLRGTCGLAFVAVAALLLVLAWDLRSYSLLKPEQPMATLSFQAEGPQRYRVLIQEGANERSVVLDGELWQLDARIFRWKGLAALIGLAPGYRLDALSGRFLALEQQSRGRRLGGFAKAFDEFRRRAVGQRQPIGNSRPPPLQGTKGDPRRAQRL